MIIFKETAGDTLIGVIDGANTVFVTSFDLELSYVNVYLNGRLKVASLDDGFTTTPPRTVTLKEAPLVGDTLEVEYKSDVKTGGGAEGGVPGPITAEEDIAVIQSLENIPRVGSDEIEPGTISQGEAVSVVFPDDLKPVIISPEEC